MGGFISHIMTTDLADVHIKNKSIVYPLPEGTEYSGSGVAVRPNPPSDDSFLDIVDRRVSIRSFAQNVVISEHEIHNILRVARLAPSAGNLQAYQVVVVRDSVQKIAIAEAAVHQSWIATASVILVFLADAERSSRKYYDRGQSLYSIQDATIAATYTQLATEAAGFSSCWVGAFHENVIAQLVGASTDVYRPVVVMPIGVAIERHQRRGRRAVKDFVHHGQVGISAPSSHRKRRLKRGNSSNEDEE